MKTRVIINGRSLSQPQTGVQRFSREIIARFDQQTEIVGLNIPSTAIVSHLWEQLLLPKHIARHEVLFSPANTGPLAVKNQVVVIHDLGVIDHPEWYSPLFGAWYRFLLPRLGKRVHKIITVSGFSKKRIVELFNISETKIIVVNNGVSNFFYPRPAEEVATTKKKLGLPNRYYLFVGSLQPRKNLRGLFRAWEIVIRRNSDARLVVVGAGNKIYRNKGFGEVPRGVDFLGYVGQEDLPAIYSDAEALVYPSFYEGFGLPVLEAMACGTPVISSNRTALPEVVGEAGLMVNPADAKELADAMVAITSNTDVRKGLIQAGLARAKEFSWDQSARQVWDILQEESN